MGIDEARCNDETSGVDHLFGGYIGKVADGGDPSVLDGHIRLITGTSGTIDDRSAENQ